MNSSALASSPATLRAHQFSKKTPLKAKASSARRMSTHAERAPTAAAGVAVKSVPTTPIEGQKTGTSGLRKKAAEFSSGNYLANWVQSLFLALPADELAGSAMVGRCCWCVPVRAAAGSGAASSSFSS
jgi:phosphoglucomutase